LVNPAETGKAFQKQLRIELPPPKEVLDPQFFTHSRILLLAAQITNILTMVIPIKMENLWLYNSMIILAAVATIKMEPQAAPECTRP
jgi:hypothetical protein